MNNWPNKPRWYSTAIESAVKLVASQEHYGQDALVVQANSFINTALTMFAQELSFLFTFS